MQPGETLAGGFGYLKRIPYIKAGRCLRFDPQAVFNSLRHLPTMEVAGKR